MNTDHWKSLIWNCRIHGRSQSWHSSSLSFEMSHWNYSYCCSCTTRVWRVAVALAVGSMTGDVARHGGRTKMWGRCALSAKGDLTNLSQLQRYLRHGGSGISMQMSQMSHSVSYMPLQNSWKSFCAVRTFVHNEIKFKSAMRHNTIQVIQILHFEASFFRNSSSKSLIGLSGHIWTSPAWWYRWTLLIPNWTFESPASPTSPMGFQEKTTPRPCSNLSAFWIELAGKRQTSSQHIVSKHSEKHEKT